MRQYHVYGMGNALLDIEYPVDDAFLREHQLHKSTAILMEYDRYQQFMADLIHIKGHRFCGGSGANTMIALRQLGSNVFYSCRVANDVNGDIYYEDLIRWGIDTNLRAEGRLPGHTGTCLILHTPDTQRTMSAYLGITNDFSESELVPAAITEADYLFIEGYLASSPSACHAVTTAKQIAQQNDTRIAISLSDINIVHHYPENLHQMLSGKIDLLFCNEQEALAFTDAGSLATALERLKNVARCFAVTQASDGAILYNGKQLFDIDAHAVNAVDTLGAGDMFAGTFLYGITQGFDFKKAGKIASIAAAMIVSKFGPRLDEEEVEELKALIAQI